MHFGVRNGLVAVSGGTSQRTKKLPPWPYFAEDEITAVADVMRCGRVNYCTGQQGREFEHEFAVACACKHAVAVANGTVALELALRCLGIGAADHVVTSSRTFVASASCIAMLSATPIFADVDRDTQNITPETIREVLTPQTRAIVVVHLAGHPCEMDSILQLARERNLFVVEDCAQAQGATYRGRPVGSFGHVAAFSFCQDKITSTLGEGGMLTTSSSEMWQRAAAFRDHGQKLQATLVEQEHSGFRWVHDSVGTNWRMTEAQATVGRKQLKKVAMWLEKRRKLASIFVRRLSQIPALRVPLPPSHVGHAYYRFYVFVRPERLKPGWTRDLILQAINAEGVPCFSGSCGEVYLEKAFAGMRPPTRRQVASELRETSLAFLVHPTINEEDIEDVACAVEKVMASAS